MADPKNKHQEREVQIMSLIYNKINDMIGAGNQLFCMQFPAQPLNWRKFEYDTSERSSVLTRPWTVAEQEFRLSDQLFDVSPITAGSNGDNLSVVYKTLINNFIPKLDYLAPFFKDRAGLANFLNEPSGELDDNNMPLTRIELFKNLYMVYLNAKNEWNKEKEKKFNELTSKIGADGNEKTPEEVQKGFDTYAKWQSSTGMVRAEELNALHNDLVVRGLLHEVLTVLGYLNASSISEELEIGKQKMRNSARLSLDESLTVYPVQMVPNNWFKGLKPNMNPEDLTMSKDVVRDIYLNKKRELSRLRTEIAQAEAIQPSQEDLNQAQVAANDARTEHKKKEEKAFAAYNVTFREKAKQFWDVFGSAKKVITKRNAISLFGEDEDINKLVKDLQTLFSTKEMEEAMRLEREAMEAAKNYNKLQSLFLEQKSKDWKYNLASIKQQALELEMDVKYYSGLVSGVLKASLQENEPPVKVNVVKAPSSGNTKSVKISIRIQKMNEQALQMLEGSFDLKQGEDKTLPYAIISTWSKGKLTNPKDTLKTFVNTLISEVATLDVTGGDDWTDEEPWYLWEGTITKIPTAKVGVIESIVLDDSKLKATFHTPEDASSSSLLPKPASEADAEVAAMFTDISMMFEEATSASNQTVESRSSKSKWKVSTWFASAQSDTERSQAEARQVSHAYNQKIEIGFRVAKVSFDRGGWFNPYLFKMSHAFSNLASTKVSNGVTVEDVRNLNQTELDHRNTYVDKRDGGNKSYPCVLPAFPIAMAVVKDLTIRIATTSSTSKSTKKEMEKSMARNANVFGFSCSSSKSVKNSSSDTFHGQKGNHFYIRIPGPQVLGYFMQMVPKDHSEDYEPIYKKGTKTEIQEAFELFKKGAHTPDSDPKIGEDMLGRIQRLEAYINKNQ